MIRNLLAAGPDVGVTLPDGRTHGLGQHLLPLLLLTMAAALLAASFLLPYWSMELDAPQYPQGLGTTVYANHLEGDVEEIDALNHYLGLPPLDDGGKVERALAPYAIAVFATFLVAAAFVHPWLSVALAAPTLLFPIVFLADLKWILYTYGHSIDPESPLGGAIDPFTPPLFGRGVVGQFVTIARAEAGLWLVVAAVVVASAGVFAHWRACKPLFDARAAQRPSTAEPGSAGTGERA